MVSYTIRRMLVLGASALSISVVMPVVGLTINDDPAITVSDGRSDGVSGGSITIENEVLAVGQPMRQPRMDHLRTRMRSGTPLNHNKDSVPSIRDAADSIVTLIDNGDSQMGDKWGIRSTGGLPTFLNTKGITNLGMLYSMAKAGIERKHWQYGSHDPAAPGGWTSNTELGIGSAWGDGNRDHHTSTSVQLVHDLSASGADQVGTFMIPVGDFNLATGDEITFVLFYRKINPFDLDLQLNYARRNGDGHSDGAGAPNVRMLAGNGTEIGTISVTNPSSAFYSDAAGNGITHFGFEIRTSTSAAQYDTTDGVDPRPVPVSGTAARMELLGVLAFRSESAGEIKILDSSHSDGLIYLPFHRSGLDASELLAGSARAVRQAVVDEVAKILGTSTTPATDPIDGVMYRFGHNEDVTNSYIDGLDLLRSEWDTVLSGGSHTHDFYAMWGATDRNPRMLAQSESLFEYCQTNGYGFSNAHLFYGGLDNIENAMGTDPFGSSYGTYEMNGTTQLHPDSNETVQSIWEDWYKHTDTPAPCTADLSGDGELDFADISLFVSSYQSVLPAADLNGDGQYDFADISIFVSAFSKGCP